MMQTNINFEYIIILLGYLITIIISIVGWFIGGKYIHRQVSKQHEKDQELEKSVIRKTVEIETAKEGLTIIHGVESKCSTLDVYISNLVDRLKMEYSYSIISEDWQDCPIKVAKLYQEYQSEMLNFMRFYEKNEIVLLKFEEMYSTIYELSNTIREAESKLAFFLVEKYHFKYLRGNKLNHYELDELEQLIKALRKYLMDNTCFLCDFRKGLQNVFLSDIFNVSVPARQPNDPKYKVLHPLE